MDTVQSNPKAVETDQQVDASDGKDTEVRRASQESTNLLKKAYEEWLSHAEEMDKLQTLVERAHKRNHELETQIQEAYKRNHAAARMEYELALKKMQEKYNAYDTTRNKARRTENTGSSEKIYMTTRRTTYPNGESLRRANAFRKASVEGTKRFLVTRKSAVVISSGSEDSDDEDNTVRVKNEGTQNNITG